MGALDLILSSHLNNCVSLSSLVNNMLTSFILLSSIFYISLKYVVKTPSNTIVKLLREYYVNMKYESMVINFIWISIVISSTFMLYRIIIVTVINNNPNSFIIKNKVALFYILLNVITLIFNIVLEIFIKKSNDSVAKSLKKWRKTLGTTASIIYDMLLLNSITLLAFAIMNLGYCNLILPPMYISLFIKYLI